MKRQNNEIKPTSEDENIKQNIIKTRNVIRKKFRDLHNHKLFLNKVVNETYKPIIEPLNALVKQEKNKQEQQEEQEEQIKNGTKKKKTKSAASESIFRTAFAPHRKKNETKNSSFFSDISGVSPMFDDALDSDEAEDNIMEKLNSADLGLDSTYGFRSANNGIVLGKDPVSVKTMDKALYYTVKDQVFPVTSGLTDLLLLSNPVNYTLDDLGKYKDMLELTNAHKVDYDPKNAIKEKYSNPKFRKVVSQIFPPPLDPSLNSKATSSGQGFIKGTYTNPKYKKVTRSTLDGFSYVYWDDPNELVERLRLLTASRSAGHTGHGNEIISIIEELREAKIIK